MNIIVVGKKNHIHWPYYVQRGFLQNNCNVSLFYYNEHTLFSRLNNLVTKRNNLEKFILILKETKPTIVFFVSAFFIPIEFYQEAKQYARYTIGWVGDTFGQDGIAYKNYIDRLYVFDSSLVTLANNLGFRDVELLQVGYDKEIHLNKNSSRTNSINFIGSFTKERELIFQKLHQYQLDIYGVKWNKMKNTPKHWKIQNKKISPSLLSTIYNTTLLSINIKQAENVSNGVNMRTFETLACGNCILTDYVSDITLCFEPNKEILTYNSIEELIVLLEKCFYNKNFVQSILMNAQKRLDSSSYSYKDRMEYVIKNL